MHQKIYPSYLKNWIIFIFVFSTTLANINKSEYAIMLAIKNIFLFHFFFKNLPFMRKMLAYNAMNTLHRRVGMSCRRQSYYFHSYIYATLWMKFWLSSATKPRKTRIHFCPKDEWIFSRQHVSKSGKFVMTRCFHRKNRHWQLLPISLSEESRIASYVTQKCRDLPIRTTNVLGSYLNGEAQDASNLPCWRDRVSSRWREEEAIKSGAKEDRKKKGKNKGARRDYFLGEGGNSKAAAISPPTTVRLRMKIPVFQSRNDRSRFSTRSKESPRFVIFWLCLLPLAACNHWKLRAILKEFHNSPLLYNVHYLFHYQLVSRSSLWKFFQKPKNFHFEVNFVALHLSHP